mmetsp:Transcript_5264/g.17480  ORF Transcript_5264/g.17480 Transcript_5264/m.17480 type:complete len:242 (+) Transcript_5264:97-822(+)
MRGGWQGARSPARGRRRRRRRAQLNHKPQARHILYHLAIGCSPNIARHPSAYRTARCKSRLCCTRHSTLSLSRSSPQGGATSAGSLLPLPLPPPPLASGSAHDCSSASSCLAVVGSWRRYRAAACQRRRHTATSTSPSAASPCRSIRALGPFLPGAPTWQRRPIRCDEHTCRKLTNSDQEGWPVCSRQLSPSIHPASCCQLGLIDTPGAPPSSTSDACKGTTSFGFSSRRNPYVSRSSIWL